MIGFARTLGASVALAGALAGILASGVGCGGAVVKKERPPAPVAVADAKSENVPITFDTIGSVVPFATVAVQPRVSGPITNIAFKEGQLVDKGALLFEIDSAPYAA
ncbi:MAG TPA: biotin/lipoyl-binding protein, partial [Myxococcota bacterium]